MGRISPKIGVKSPGSVQPVIMIKPGGARGPVGLGVAIGGTTGQFLKKQSNTDYDTVWVSDLGQAIAQWNASQIEGKAVDITGVQDTYVIKYQLSSDKFVVGPASVVATLDDLTDVTISSPSDTQVLQYEGASSQWKNKTINGASIILNEVPTGTVDGANTVFTTAYGFVNTKLTVYKNGVRMKDGGNDYTSSLGNTITFVTAPATGDVILVDYVRSDSVLVGNTSYQNVNETPAGTVNGANAVFTTVANYIAGTIQVYLNGLLQTKTTDYTESAANTITFVTAPLTGDDIKVTYQTALTPAGNADTLDGQHGNFYMGICGMLQNGKLVTAISGNNLVVSLKTLAGTDPTASDPIKVRIGNAIESITAALTFTINAGANSFNTGSSEFATKEIDYFAYVGKKAADGSIFLGIARIPYGATYADFSGTATNEKAFIGSTTPASTDVVEVCGRISAILSAGAGYTWTLGTSIIQRPIWETRWLSWQPTFGAVSPMTYTTVTTDVAQYKVGINLLDIKVRAYGTVGGTLGQSLTYTLPFSLDTSNANNELAYFTSLYDVAPVPAIGSWNHILQVMFATRVGANLTAGASKFIYGQYRCSI